MTESRSKAIQRLEKEIIPESLGGLSDKAEYVQQVLNWAESNYKDSNGQIERKIEIQKQTKEYLTEILDLVAGEIETNALNLSEYLEYQNENLNELGIEIDLLSNRLQLRKEQEVKMLFEKVMDFKLTSVDKFEENADEDDGMRANEKNDDDDDALDSTLHGLLESKHLIRIDDETNLQYENAKECYVNDMGLASTVEAEVNPAYRNANNQYNALRFVENFEDDLQ